MVDTSRWGADEIVAALLVLARACEAGSGEAPGAGGPVVRGRAV